MPIYFYKCPSGHSAQLSRRIEDRDEPVACEACRSEMKRNLDFGAIKFNGKGFYRTDK